MNLSSCALSLNIRAASALALALILTACGGGGGVSVPAGVTVGAAGTTDPDTPGTGSGTPTVPPAPTCDDVSGAIASSVRFSATDKGADALVSSTGQTVCFTASTPSAVRSTTAIQPGSFYYFEAKRSPNTVAVVGVATAAMPLVPNNTGATDIFATDQALFLRDGSAETQRLVPPPALTYSASPFNVGSTETTFGFAVDYRGSFPVVYVLGSTAAAATDGIAADQCTGTGVVSSTSTPCVYGVQLLPGVTGGAPLYIYAFGSTFAGGSPKVSINGGTDLTARAYTYAPVSLRNALRKRWLYGERQLNAQWPQTSTQAAAAGLPTIAVAANSNARVVSRAVIWTADPTPTTPRATYTNDFAVTAADSAGAALTGANVQWLTETGALIGTGTTLSLTAANTISTVGGGSHRIQAVVTDPTTRQVAGVDFVLTYTATDGDDDGDGLGYSQEKTYGTDPSNPDSDGDGLSDSVEIALGVTYNPAVFDTTGSGQSDGRRRAGNPALPLAVQLARETGANGTATNPGVVLMDDKLTIALTSLINPDCQLDRGVFAGAGRAGTVNGEEECKKRAIRTDTTAGIKPGEFRYFETRRLLPNANGGAPNMGQGFITATGRIDPFCCVQNVGTTPVAGTPPSFMLNSASSIWDTLVSIANFETLTTFYVGFAVDYRTSPPKAYAITAPAAGGTTPVIYGPRTIAGFTGDVIPFVYGHPQSDSLPALEINYGLKTFNYDAATVRGLIDTASGVAGTGALMTRGVGIHYQP